MLFMRCIEWRMQEHLEILKVQCGKGTEDVERECTVYSFSSF